MKISGKEMKEKERRYGELVVAGLGLGVPAAEELPAHDLDNVHEDDAVGERSIRKTA